MKVEQVQEHRSRSGGVGGEETENQPCSYLSLELFPANPSYCSGWSFETEVRFLKAILAELAPAYAEQVEA